MPGRLPLKPTFIAIEIHILLCVKRYYSFWFISFEVVESKFLIQVFLRLAYAPSHIRI